MSEDKSISNYLKERHVSPPRCSFNPQLANNKKEGKVEVHDEKNAMISSLEHKNDFLNGVWKLFKNDTSLENIPHHDDVYDGWGYEYDVCHDKRYYLYEECEKKMELTKSKMKKGYYDEMGIEPAEIISICKLTKNHKHEREYVFKNRMINKIVMYDYGFEKNCLKEFCENVMIEYDENGKKVYEGGFLNSFEKEYPREGYGEEYCGNVMIYKGEWKDDKRNGRGMSLRNKRAYFDGMWKDNLPKGEGTMFENGKMICKGGKWVKGRLQMENGKWMKYEKEMKEIIVIVGWNNETKLVIQGKDIVYKDWSNLISLECSFDRDDIILSKWIDEIDNYGPCNEPIEYGQTIDLSDEGDRWEGGCLNGKPIGNGSLFDSNNRIVYKGLLYNGKKVCYGEEYYADSGTVEYRGCFVNGLRHGWGCLYDLKGKLMYEGNWYLGKNDHFTLRVPDECEDDGMISNVLKEVIIGNNCYKELDELIIYDFNELKRLKIGNNSFKNVEQFEIQKCDKLRELIIGDGYLEQKGCFSKVRSFKLSSMIDLTHLN